MTTTCQKHPICQLGDRKRGRVKLSGIYRVRLGCRQGQRIWLVDGEQVGMHVYQNFIMGGNDQRYRYNPNGEVWIDNRIGIEELEYTIAHELIERKLMRQWGWSYTKAHNHGLALEHKMRLADEARARRHGAKTGIEGVYRAFFGKVHGLSVWIVDGPTVRKRKELDPDFCFGANDLASSFVPRGEIWLDSAMSVEQAYYTLLREVTERRLLAAGASTDEADACAQVRQFDERLRQARLRVAHEKALPPVHYGARARGVRLKSNKKEKR